MEEKKQSGQRRVIVLLLGLIVLLLIVLVVFLARGRTQNISDSDTPLIGYSSEAKVMLDEDALQAAVNEAMENAKNGMVALQYQNDAYSTDGKTFSCHIANSPANMYDMFLTLFSDAEMKDQLYLSGLVPPGSGFEEITLDKELELGDHVVYVVLTQVDIEDGQQVMKNQVVHTIKFHVAG